MAHHHEALLRQPQCGLPIQLMIQSVQLQMYMAQVPMPIPLLPSGNPPAPLLSHPARFHPRTSESHHPSVMRTLTKLHPHSVKPLLLRSMTTELTGAASMLHPCREIHIPRLITKLCTRNEHRTILAEIPGASPHRPFQAQRGTAHLGPIPQVFTTGTRAVRTRNTPWGMMSNPVFSRPQPFPGGCQPTL